MNMFSTSFLMGIYSDLHQTNLHIEEKVLDDFYIWLHGLDLGGRQSPPSLRTMMHVERVVWRKI